MPYHFDQNMASTSSNITAWIRYDWFHNPIIHMTRNLSWCHQEINGIKDLSGQMTGHTFMLKLIWTRCWWCWWWWLSIILINQYLFWYFSNNIHMFNNIWHIVGCSSVGTSIKMGNLYYSKTQVLCCITLARSPMPFILKKPRYSV